jgi:hypothetical protein
MNCFINLIEKNPVEYDFAAINEFITKINKMYNLTGKSSNLNDIKEEEYQQLLRILVHKANDDHTGVYFVAPKYLYSGFTAYFDTIASN